MIWLIGDRGMLGTELRQVLASRSMPYLGSDREVDIRELQALRAFAAGKGIRCIINCSAYTNVDKAEEEEELARGINALGAGNIALVARELGAVMIHVSTDYVFRGDADRPYEEADPLDPAGAYGRTKAEGERLVAAAAPRHYIVRTAWLYGRYGPNFVYTMLKHMKVKPALNVVNDQRGTPTWAYDLAHALADLASRKDGPYGTYHYTNEGQTTWHGFATEIERLGREAGILQKPCTVDAIKSDEYPSKVKRPAWSVLSKAKTRQALGLSTPDWQASLACFMAQAPSWPELKTRIE